MSERRLREILSELHQELERTEAVDEGVRAELRAAQDEIEHALDQDRDRAKAHLGVARTRIGRAIERAEREHIDGVEMLQRVLHALSNVGI